MAELEEKARKIKAVVLDGDGVFFTGRALIGPEQGEVLKERSHIDGQGISFLRAAGIRVAIVSGEKTGFVEIVGKKLNDLPSVREGKWPPMGIFTGHQGSDKVSMIDTWLKEAGISWDECAYMGDDFSDYNIMQKVGLASAPAQAEEEIRALAHFVAPRLGGDGAIRDLANLILRAQSIKLHTLSMR